MLPPQGFAEDAHEHPCPKPGQWVLPLTGETVAHDRFVADIAARPVVLLGEHHDNADHHRWQLSTIAALAGRRAEVVLGFESFPRAAQPVLDRWVQGELTTEEFLERIRWAETWGYGADLYLPLFRFARLHRIPMIALNIDRTLVKRVAKDGWSAVPQSERQGISDPAPASEAYRRSLATVYAMKQRQRHAPSGAPAANTVAMPDPTHEEIEAALSDPAFQHFVEAQLTWDRAMAEALRTARTTKPEALVIGVMGRGHVEHRWGVPRQLEDLGISDAAVLLPSTREEACKGLAATVADAVFVFEPLQEPAKKRARLGVMIETANKNDGVRVIKVLPESVAADAGVAEGDIIVEAAGVATATTGDLIAVIGRQAPGTWLPLTVVRGDERLDIAAKFPSNFEDGE